MPTEISTIFGVVQLMLSSSGDLASRIWPGRPAFQGSRPSSGHNDPARGASGHRGIVSAMLTAAPQGATLLKSHSERSWRVEQPAFTVFCWPYCNGLKTLPPAHNERAKKFAAVNRKVKVLVVKWRLRFRRAGPAMSSGFPSLSHAREMLACRLCRRITLHGCPTILPVQGGFLHPSYGPVRNTGGEGKGVALGRVP